MSLLGEPSVYPTPTSQPHQPLTSSVSQHHPPTHLLCLPASSHPSLQRTLNMPWASSFLEERDATCLSPVPSRAHPEKDVASPLGDVWLGRRRWLFSNEELECSLCLLVVKFSGSQMLPYLRIPAHKICSQCFDRVLNFMDT